MYAIIRTGGKQYRVQPGDKVKVEKLDQKLGSEFQVEDVLLVGSEDKTYVGTPNVDKAKVTAVVVQQAKDSKILVFKKKRRKGYRRTQGHRQLFTELFIKAITNPDGDTAKADKEAQVIDPAKKAERVAQNKEKKKAERVEAKKTGKKVAKKKTAKKKTAKKKVAKKAAKKKTAKKKTATKKKTAKKAAKKKTATKKKK